MILIQRLVEFIRRPSGDAVLLWIFLILLLAIAAQAISVA